MNKLYVILFLFLAGCTFAENYIEYQKENSWLQFFISDEQRLIKFKDQCKKLGFEEGTNEMEECIIRRFEASEENPNR